MSEIEVFTTRIDTIYGANFIVLAPEHPIVQRFADASADPAAFRAKVAKFTSQDRTARLTGEVEMDEMLTVAEMEAKFAPDWVLIQEPETDEQQRLLGGKVVYHSPDRDEVYRKATELGLDRIAVRYLGSWPEDMALVL